MLYINVLYMSGVPYRILGIDPGTNVMGYGIVENEGRDARVVDLGVLKLYKMENPYDKLGEIYHCVQDLIEKFSPNHVAIEAPFYGKNIQSMLKLGRAQGVIMAAALTMDVKITEYAPKKIKLAVTGNGNASKEQVSAMLDHIFKKKLDPKYLDASDALATALCHLYQKKNGGSNKESSWSSFIKNNPQRIKS